MAHTFKLVQRSTNPSDANAPKKWYAMAQSSGTANITELCTLIAARSTVSSADVKAVLDNLNFVIDFQLKSGRIVRMGELGSFRLSLSSKGVTNKGDFSPSMLKTPKIIFTPGTLLKETRITARFTQVSDKQEREQLPESNGGGTGNNGGTPGEI